MYDVKELKVYGVLYIIEQKRPIRLSEKTRHFAYESLDGKKGYEGVLANLRQVPFGRI